MTSSLVGSEMCIRDSPKAWIGPKLLLSDGGGDGCAPASRVTLRNSAVPVSYTHLTLPTICSV
eukprot:6133332-Prorocentrum_lima.AAC.1